MADTNITSYPLADVTRRFNLALEKLVGIAINSDGVDEFDDTNYSTSPVGPGTLIEGQQAYSFTDDYLKVKVIKVKGLNLQWYVLEQIDQSDLEGMSLENYFGQDSSGNPTKGFPTHYDILNDTIRIYPAPTATAVTLTNGLKVEFVRTASLLAVTDTTKEPGIASPYHYLLPTWAALKYCMSYKKDRVAQLQFEWNEGVKDFIKYMSRRNPDRRNIMTMKPILYM